MNENEIRELLISYLSEKFSDDPSIVFIKEIFIDNFKCRVDLVMANGHAIAFEIKSELDSLVRLPAQLESLISHFDEVIVICAEKHLTNTLSVVGDSVGVWVLWNRDGFKVIQKAKRQKPSKEQWLSHLPVSELRAFLREKSLPRTGDRSILVGTAEKEPLSIIRRYVIEYFKRRDKRISAIKERRKPVTIDRHFESHDEMIRNFLTKINTSCHIKAIPRQVRR